MPACWRDRARQTLGGTRIETAAALGDSDAVGVLAQVAHGGLLDEGAQRVVTENFVQLASLAGADGVDQFACLVAVESGTAARRRSCPPSKRRPR
jgi:hypothetical protein